ncbi:S-adenosylmethionine synthetase [Prevotella koreensis]|uniref:S-adenosylmethionine synthetase n=1 Tax=Prevotella koreensis TaxID=2490854 RepID=UPI0028E2AD64|nr:S-adenosylmethionine synthetase [Prevotella koreensis]
MNENLLDRVSVENLDALHDALSEVIGNMRHAGENHDSCFRDEAYWACFQIRNMVFASLRRRAKKTEGNRL